MTKFTSEQVQELRQAIEDKRTAQAKINAIEEKCKGIGEQLFLEDAQALFTKHPELNQFGWRQYAPYFNDGDPCNFIVWSENIKINEYGYRYDYDDEDADDCEGAGQGLTEKQWTDIKKDACTLIDSFDKDSLEEWFGYDNEVLVSRDGVQSECYGSHD